MNEVDILEGRVARLEVANARLCAQVNETADALAACGRRCRELEALSRDMYADFQRIFEGGRKEEYERRMWVLGIEVAR